MCSPELSYLAGKAESDVALLSWIHNLHLKVVTPGTQRLPSLCKTHIDDALPFPYIFQELQREDKTIADCPSGLTLHLLKSPQAAIIVSTSSVVVLIIENSESLTSKRANKDSQR